LAKSGRGIINLERRRGQRGRKVMNIWGVDARKRGEETSVGKPRQQPFNRTKYMKKTPKRHPKRKKRGMQYERADDNISDRCRIWYREAGTRCKLGIVAFPNGGRLQKMIGEKGS